MTSRKRHFPKRALSSALVAVAMAACGMDGPDNRVLLRPNGDVLAAGEDVRISESVAGDAMAAGGSIVFDGTVGGSYVGAGGNQRIGGRIDGSVRAAGGTVVVTADVGRNVTLAGGTLEVEPGGSIERNAYLAGGTVRLTGSVAGDVYVGAREVLLDGVIGGDVRVEAEHLTVGPNARLGGDLRYRTEEGATQIDPGAQIAGEMQMLEPRDEPGPGAAFAFMVFRLLAFLVTGTVLVAIFPGTLRSLSASMGHKVGASLGFGVLALLAVPLAALVAAITLVGLPLAAVTAVLFGIALYLAPVVPAVWIGDALLSGREAPERRGVLKYFLVGGVIVAIAMLLPWVGILARLIVVAMGLGAVAVMLFGSHHRTEASI
ncbi:MAG: polymer-forming cytoskeletal protein [Gemmatimonadales bacterium]